MIARTRLTLMVATGVAMFAPAMLGAQAVAYSPAAPDAGNTYTVTGAPAACRDAVIVVDTKTVKVPTTKVQVTDALDGKASTVDCNCHAPDGALQEAGMCKASVYVTTVQVTVYQRSGQGEGSQLWMPHQKFWVPFDPRTAPGSTVSGEKILKCVIPIGTVVAIGVRKNTYSSDAYMTQWYIGNSMGMGVKRSQVPTNWRCSTLG